MCLPLPHRPFCFHANFEELLPRAPLSRAAPHLIYLMIYFRLPTDNVRKNGSKLASHTRKQNTRSTFWNHSNPYLTKSPPATLTDIFKVSRSVRLDVFLIGRAVRCLSPLLIPAAQKNPTNAHIILIRPAFQLRSTFHA